MAEKYKLVHALKDKYGDPDANNMTKVIEREGLRSALERRKREQEEKKKQEEAHQLRLKRGY